MIEFEWDAEKADANRRKHSVSFEEARSVFYDEFADLFGDPAHSTAEHRFIMLGASDRLRILVVCHCERLDGNVIRIISARKATARERRQYRGPLP